MNWVNFNYKLSNINNLLESSNSALEGKLNGQKASDILIDFGMNVTNGALRNEIAYDIKRTTGSDLGIAINDAAGYGSAAANQKGMQGLMGASLFNGLFGRSWFGGCGGGYPVMGGGCCNNGFMGGYMGSMMGPTFTSPGIFGGMYNGMTLPSVRATPYFGSGMSVFQNNRFFS